MNSLRHMFFCNSYTHLLDEKFRIILCTTLYEDGTVDEGEFQPLGSKPSRADHFDYVMYGKIYRIDTDDSMAEHQRLYVVLFILFLFHFYFSWESCFQFWQCG